MVFAQSALETISISTARGAKGIEVCGVLIGTGYRDTQGPYLLVETLHPWQRSCGQIHQCYLHPLKPGRQFKTRWTACTRIRKMIGVYHTHPSFGIFLSDMDIFICDNFFNIPWQVAFVYDPVSGEEGNFVWRANRPQREPDFD